MTVEVVRKFSSHDEFSCEWEISTSDFPMHGLVISLPAIDGVRYSQTSLAGRHSRRITLSGGVHRSLVGDVVAALESMDRAALINALWDCSTPTRKAVCFLVHREGLILAVSRKRDRTRFGLPGGKVDPGETEERAAIRELREETGLVAEGVVSIFEDLCRGRTNYACRTFVSESLTGEIQTDEPVDVRWVEPEVLLQGPFAEYNRKLMRYMGIPFRVE